MPVLHAKQTEDDLWVNAMADAPGWCELAHYAIVTMADEGKHSWPATCQANKLVVVEGSCEVAGERVERGQSLDLPAGDYIVTADGAVTFVTLGGDWGADCGGAGIFGAVESDELGDMGDPVDYPKRTRFDRHYHDCDEYWILVKGRGTASSENVLYDVGPGDCVATRMGNHHDFPLVDEPVLAVFFETTMRGEKRRGHLWEHTHGPAVPAG